MRRGSDIPVRLEGHELEVVWAAAYRSRTSGPVRASRRRKALGLPRVSNREAECRLRDNRARTARRFRAAARAREGASAPLTAPEVLATPDVLATLDIPQNDTRHVILLGSTHADPPTSSPPGRTYSPCTRCLNCACRQPKNYSSAHSTHVVVTNTSLSTMGSESIPSLPLTGTPPAMARGPAG